MLRLRELLHVDDHGNDEGFSLVEVVVALLVFAVITAGSVAAIGTIMSMTGDNRAREIATNVAQQAIDEARADARNDIMGMADRSYSITADSRSYAVRRTVSWLTTGGIDSKCSTTATTGTGALLFRHVNVAVTWPNMRAGTRPVRADTVFSPSSKINDPAAGTILISVQSVTGSGGVGGVSVSITPNGAVVPNTAAVIPAASQPAPTNTDGCTYATKVPPGAYTVTVSGPRGVEYRDTKQKSVSTQSVVVKAGDSGNAPFTYDPALHLAMKYAPQGPGYSGPAPAIPTDLTTTFVSTLDPWRDNAPDADQYLSPTNGGYQVYAGPFTAGASPTSPTGCLSVDPTAWPATADGKTGKAPQAVSGAPGADVNAPVGMGIVSITVKNTDQVVRATTTAGANGDPGCLAGMTLNFTRQRSGPTNGTTTMTIALPYGTWSIASGSSTSTLGAVTLGSVIGGILGAVLPGTGNVVTVDPRTP
jgi:prepilin-type N-terminal cleavage/methylation domain-containing protein